MLFTHRHQAGFTAATGWSGAAWRLAQWVPMEKWTFAKSPRFWHLEDARHERHSMAVAGPTPKMADAHRAQRKSPGCINNRGFHILAGEEGFEPSHAGIKIQCLNQLGDSPRRPLLYYTFLAPQRNLLTNTKTASFTTL